MKIKSYIFDLKNRHLFRIAHGLRESTQTFILELLDDDGLIGYGEATPVPYYGVSAQEMQALLFMHLETIQNFNWEHPADLWKFLDSIISHNHFLMCALDIAAWDLWAKKRNKPLYELMGYNISNTIYSNYTIGIGEIDEMIMKMKEFDFPIYKIKLGTEHDLEILKALRKETDAIFRVDANCGWSVEETIRNAENFKKLGVEFIEQPLKANDFEGMKMLIKSTKFPIIADESCISESDVEQCNGLFSGINIKLAKCGGITPAMRMIEKARRYKMKVMMGCMTESSIGISALAQMAPALDYADFDGALLIANDPADGVKIEGGKIIYTDRKGHGGILTKFENI